MSEPPSTLRPGPTLARHVVDGVRCVDEFREDERLLRTGHPVVRVSVLSELALSYGVGVRDDAAYVTRARSAGVSVARRTSGGTGVLHASGDLAWSVVLPRSHPAVGRDFIHGYSRLGAGVIRFLEQHGREGRWECPPDLLADFCLLSGRGEVLSVGPSILGGAAQHLTHAALLHQGMIARSLDRDRAADLFHLADPGVLARLTCLKELGVTGAPLELANQLADALVDTLAARDG